MSHPERRVDGGERDAHGASVRRTEWRGERRSANANRMRGRIESAARGTERAREGADARAAERLTGRACA